MSLDATIVQLARTRPFDEMPRDALQLVAFSAETRKLAAGEELFWDLLKTQILKNVQ